MNDREKVPENTHKYASENAPENAATMANNNFENTTPENRQIVASPEKIDAENTTPLNNQSAIKSTIQSN